MYFHFSFFISKLSAHPLWDQLPRDLYTIKWDWNPASLLFFTLGLLYFKGLKSFKGKIPVANWQITLYYTGLGILILSVIPPVDPLASQLFFMHMIQHLLIVEVGVPLMLFGAPFFVISRGIPPFVRKKFYLPLIKNKPSRKFINFLSLPIISLVLFQANFLFWHIPLFYNLALFNDAIHFLQHFAYAFTAIFLWRNIIDPYPMHSKLSMINRILYLGSYMASNVILSAILTFSDEVYYGYAGLPIPQWWTWGRLMDQQLGGLIMWVPGEFLNFFGMTAVFFIWVAREKAKAEKEKM